MGRSGRQPQQSTLQPGAALTSWLTKHPRPGQIVSVLVPETNSGRVYVAKSVAVRLLALELGTSGDWCLKRHVRRPKKVDVPITPKNTKHVSGSVVELSGKSLVVITFTPVFTSHCRYTPRRSGTGTAFAGRMQDRHDLHATNV